MILNLSKTVVRTRRLKYSPPTLVSPTILNVDISTFPSDGTFTFGMDEDVIINLPNYILQVPKLQINYGRNVIVRGGHMLSNTGTATSADTALLRFTGQSGVIFIEGIILDCNNNIGKDAIEVGAPAHLPDRRADIYLQNCIMKNIDGTADSALHADGYQFYGNTKGTYIDRCVFIGQYQLLFLDPQHQVESIHLSNIDMFKLRPNEVGGYPFYLKSSQTSVGGNPIVEIGENVYVDTNMATGGYTQWDLYSLYPPSNVSWGCVRTGNTASFPNIPNVSGSVILLDRNKPHVVKEKYIGLGYISPGYLK